MSTSLSNYFGLISYRVVDNDKLCGALSGKWRAVAFICGSSNRHNRDAAVCFKIHRLNDWDLLNADDIQIELCKQVLQATPNL